MTKRMLIDATQPEETRVAVVEGERLDSYDFDSSVRKQIKGNIFLAKVTRVEPSLQACFVEYGGNRQGFLAFTEIHPDYYRIPVEDRQALLAEEAEMEEGDDEFEGSELRMREPPQPDQNFDDFPEQDGAQEQDNTDDFSQDEPQRAIAADNTSAEMVTSSEVPFDDMPLPQPANLTEVERDNTIERVGGGEEESPLQNRARRQGRLRKRYKIQEVIKRRQIMLVQATKEERGQKGAAMTTYISLPGRYCVLMPNSPRGGGVSRKITDPRARRKMKELLAELNVPKGMSIILRTAGITRSKIEIKRDFDYLLKLWDEIRRETMQSVAPAMVYEEADIFKRTIRDLYSRDTAEIIVAGEAGYRKVKTFMHQMVPAHAPRVKFYRDTRIPLFQAFGIEHQIADIFSPRVELRSGGYIIINPTEALVSIDVNSGRATRERHIDDTALKTNMEAATEVARQLRLRDLGGLVVIDFIDMDLNRHNAKVERRLREAMSIDRARIEIGRISGFGLLELSRQRLHPSLTETHFEVCPHCAGTGLVRTIDSAAVVAMRAIEAEAVKGKATLITANVPQPVAVYILNHKREEMNRIEDYFGCRVSLRVDENMNLNDMNVETEKGNPVPRKTLEQLPVPFIEGVDDQPVVEDEPDIEPENDDDFTPNDHHRHERHEASAEGDEEGGEGRRGNGNNRPRRGRRGGRNRHRDRPDRGNDRRAGQPGDEQPSGEGHDAVLIPITEGYPEQNNGPNNGSNNGLSAGGAETAPGEDTPNGENRGRRNNSRRGGRHPYRRNRNNDRRGGGDDRTPRDDHQRRSIHAADAPMSEPASIITVQEKSSTPKQADKAANDGNGEEKRAWWQKLME